MAETLFTKLTAAARTAQSSDGAVHTKEFLNTCRLVLPVIDQMGTGLAIVKSDIKGNIDRLASREQTDPVKYAAIWSIVEDEVAKGEQGASSSSTKGLLWLKRAMEFMLVIFSRLESDSSATMSTAVSAAYDATLKKFHGYLVYGTFMVALNLVPSKESFFAAIANDVPEQELRVQMKEFVDVFGRVLAALHGKFVDSGLDDPTPV